MMKDRKEREKKKENFTSKQLFIHLFILASSNKLKHAYKKGGCRETEETRQNMHTRREGAEKQKKHVKTYVIYSVQEGKNKIVIQAYKIN